MGDDIRSNERKMLAAIHSRANEVDKGNTLKVGYQKA
jgi:hypothetical protein